MRVTKIIKSSKKKNKAMNKTELNEILKLHKLWLNGDPKGRCASLQDANLSGANLKYAILSDANLMGADLSDANLMGADLSDANLMGADLSGADLSGADLSFVNLRNANLSNADLEGADLRGADLQDADLRNVDLSGAILTGADLRNAILSGATLSGAYLSFVNLRNATFNKETVFPDGFDPVSCGMKLVEEKVPEAPSPTKQEEVVAVAAVPAAPKTLHEEIAEVLAKMVLIWFLFRSSLARVVPTRVEENPLTRTI